MATIHINKGHNLKLAGSPKKEVKSLSCPKKIKIIPDNFPGVKPKMQITTNDQVKIGSKLFFDKNNPEVHFCSPVSGNHRGRGCAQDLACHAHVVREGLDRPRAQNAGQLW